MHRGWLSLHRKIQEHWLYQEKRKFSKFEAWIDLLMMANHEDRKILHGNELIEVKRGERITSIRQLCEQWNWSNTKVTQFLNLLQSDGMIVVKSDSKKTIVSIVNYDFYQGGNDKETTQKRQGNDTETIQKHTNNNVNNSNNKNNENKERDISADGAAPSSSSIVKKIINYLNEKTGKRFSHKSEANSKLINARLREGITLDDFKHVIDVKAEEWINDEKMSEFLRPATLFSGKNFESYVNQNLKGQRRAKVSNNEDAYQEARKKWIDSCRDPKEFDEHWNYQEQRFKTETEIEQEKLKVESLSEEFNRNIRDSATTDLSH